MKDFNITLPAESINAIIQVLDELPTKTGAFPLVQEIKRQVSEQLKANEPIPQVEL